MEYNDSMGSFVPFVASLLIDFRNDACKSYLHTRKCIKILAIPFYAIEMDERKKTLSHFATIARSALVNTQTYLYIGKLSFRSSCVEERKREREREREEENERSGAKSFVFYSYYRSRVYFSRNGFIGSRKGAFVVQRVGAVWKKIGFEE